MGNPLDYDFFYGGEAEQFSFYRIPRALVTGERFRGVSTDAKLLYGLMLDRMGLSLKNGWLDDTGRVYIYYSLDEIQTSMCCAHQKACKLLSELDEGRGIGLIHRKKQGQGKPARIYVKRFTTQNDRPAPVPGQPPTTPVPDFPKPSFQSADYQKSKEMKSRSADCLKSAPNHTYVNQPYSSQLYPSIHPPATSALDGLDGMKGYDMREKVKEQIDYDRLTAECGADDTDELVELITDVYCTTRPTLRVGGEERPTAQVWERYQRLGYSHIKYILDSLSQNTSKVRNIRAYLLTSLYNAPATIGRYYQAEVQHDLYGGP